MDKIVLKFNDVDSQDLKILTFKNSLTMKEALEKYLDEIKAYKTLDPNIYIFQLGNKILNKPKNLNLTLDEIGLSSDIEIKLIRKKNRKYAKYIKIILS